MNTLLLGFGEVGQAIYSLLKDFHNIDYVSLEKENLTRPIENNTVLLVAIPYSNKFRTIVRKYQEKLNIKATIIFSTVPIGTSRSLNAVHSPVEGRHPDLEGSMKVMKRWVGGRNKIASQFFWNAGIKVMQVPNPEFTEFLKLRSTSLYGLNIEFARYSKEVSDDLKMPFEMTCEYDEDYNELYKTLGCFKFQRYILDAPEGNIGGHCVVPNAKLLDEQYPSIFLKEIYKEKSGETMSLSEEEIKKV